MVIRGLHIIFVILFKNIFLYFMSKVTSYPADYQTFPTLFELEPVAGFEDADDTNADTYGAQQLTLFNAYYGEYCYMPLLLFEGRSGRCSLFFPQRMSTRLNP